MSSLLPIFEIRKIIENIEDEKYRFALMYQFLVGGSVSEICGKYKPIGSDAFTRNIKINNKLIPAVFFRIQTARREGKLRICAIPRDSEYEPWSELILNWFQKHGERCPFVFMERSKNPRINDVYLMKKTNELFESYGLPTKEYIRNARKKNLKEFYHFNELDLALFGSWNEPVIDYATKKKISSILSSTGKPRDLSELTKMPETYFMKLLRPIRHLEQEDVPVYLQVRNYMDLHSRYYRATEISTLVKNINFLGQFKLNTPFLKENMRIILEILSPCDNEIQFTTKIASIAALFEVELDGLKKIIGKPNWRRTNRIIIQWLKQNQIPYNPEMLETWSNIKLLRNMEPIHSETDPVQLMSMLHYFGQPMSFPINYSSLWDEILEKFHTSLILYRQILNDIPRIHA